MIHFHKCSFISTDVMKLSLFSRREEEEGGGGGGGAARSVRHRRALTSDLLQPVVGDGNVLQPARLLDEEQDGVPRRHARQLAVHLGPVAQEVVDPALGHDLDAPTPRKNTSKAAVS